MTTLNEIEELKTKGHSLLEISKILKEPLPDVVALVNAQNKPPVLIEDLPPKDTPTEEDNLKNKIDAIALKALEVIESELNDNLDAGEISKLTDSVAKLHTTFFKSDPGTVVNLQLNELTQFRGLLKE